VDFRGRRLLPSTPVNIQGKDIEMVTSYKYLGVHLNNKPDWTNHITALYRNGQSRLYLLRRLRSFGVQGALLKTFFDTVVASAIFYGVVCWGSSVSAADRRRQDKLIKKASSVLRCSLDSVQVVGERRMTAKLSSQRTNDSHPMQEEIKALESSFSDRLRPCLDDNSFSKNGKVCPLCFKKLLRLYDDVIQTIPAYTEPQNLLETL